MKRSDLYAIFVLITCAPHMSAWASIALACCYSVVYVKAIISEAKSRAKDDPK